MLSENDLLAFDQISCQRSAICSTDICIKSINIQTDGIIYKLNIHLTINFFLGTFILILK